MYILLMNNLDKKKVSVIPLIVFVTSETMAVLNFFIPCKFHTLSFAIIITSAVYRCLCAIFCDWHEILWCVSRFGKIRSRVLRLLHSYP